jgi:hypothetical protein
MGKLVGVRYLYKMKILITEDQLKSVIEESYKMNFTDKQSVDKRIRVEYQNYLEKYKAIEYDIKFNNLWLEKMKRDGEPQSVIDSLKRIFDNKIYELELEQSKIHPGKPKLYNEFYQEEYNNILKNYQDTVKTKPNTTVQPESKKLDNTYVKTYFNSLNDIESKPIKRFLKIVEFRQLSGTGESIDKKTIRDAFFQTPKEFQRMFSVKPSKWFWRGDDVHPCSIDYEEDPYQFYLQSSSQWKGGAQFFGEISFPSTRIGSYGGSFSTVLFAEHTYVLSLLNLDVEIGDDEGEIMFFDVKYKCKKKFETNN